MKHYYCIRPKFWSCPKNDASDGVNRVYEWEHNALCIVVSFLWIIKNEESVKLKKKVKSNCHTTFPHPVFETCFITWLRQSTSVKVLRMSIIEEHEQRNSNKLYCRELLFLTDRMGWW